MNFKSYIKTRSVGFWISVSAAIVAAVTATVYAACYGGSKDFGVGALVCAILCAAAAAAAAFAPVVGKYMPYALVVLASAAAGCYIYSIYYYVSVVLVGIDLDSFDAKFIVNTALFVLLAVLAAVDMFFRQGEKRGESGR